MVMVEVKWHGIIVVLPKNCGEWSNNDNEDMLK